VNVAPEPILKAAPMMLDWAMVFKHEGWNANEILLCGYGNHLEIDVF
jgi:hypothetical protein